MVNPAGQGTTAGAELPASKASREGKPAAASAFPRPGSVRPCPRVYRKLRGTMWQMLCNLSVFAAIPNMLRRIERRVKHTNGPEPQEWTMRQDRIASFALPNALEHDMWAHKRKALDEDYWADMRRSSIDAEREERYVWSDAARRKRIAEQTHDVLRPGPNYGFLRPRD